MTPYNSILAIQTCAIRHKNVRGNTVLADGSIDTVDAPDWTRNTRSSISKIARLTSLTDSGSSTMLAKSQSCRTRNTTGVSNRKRVSIITHRAQCSKSIASKTFKNVRRTWLTGWTYRVVSIGTHDTTGCIFANAAPWQCSNATSACQCHIVVVVALYAVQTRRRRSGTVRTLRIALSTRTCSTTSRVYVVAQCTSETVRSRSLAAGAGSSAESAESGWAEEVADIAAETVAGVETGSAFVDARAADAGASRCRGQIEALNTGSACRSSRRRASETVGSAQKAVKSRQVVALLTSITSCGRLAVCACRFTHCARERVCESSWIVASRALVTDGSGVADLAVGNQLTALCTWSTSQVVLQLTGKAGRWHTLAAVGQQYWALVAYMSSNVEIVTNIAWLAACRCVTRQASSWAICAYSGSRSIIALHTWMAVSCWIASLTGVYTKCTCKSHIHIHSLYTVKTSISVITKQTFRCTFLTQSARINMVSTSTTRAIYRWATYQTERIGCRLTKSAHSCIGVIARSALKTVTWWIAVNA